MNIIIEGVDASGKDSLINNLSSITGREIIRGSSFEISSGGVDAMFEKSKQIILQNNNIIINRFFYSNVVYGKLYNYPMMSDEQYRQLNDMVNENAIVYYLHADTDIIMERIKRRGDDRIKPDDIKRIQDEYENMWRLYHPQTLIRVDTGDNSILDINSEIYSSILKHDSELNMIKSIQGDGLSG